MQRTHLSTAGATLLALVAAGGLAGNASAAEAGADPGLVPETEVSDIAVLPPPGPHRLLVGGNFQGGGVRVVDGDAGKVVGQFYTTSGANFVIDPNNRFYYAAESIWSRGNRGKREDYISIYDDQLRHVGEVPLPGRLIAVPKAPIFDISSDSRLGYVFNMQPATSVAVVDLQTRKPVTTVEIPGCAMVYPFGPQNFASLCGDGTLATVVRGARNYEVRRSAPFFDAEQDPVYEESLVDRQTGRALFISYTGKIYPVQLGDTSQFGETWDLLVAAGHPPASTDAERLDWRPGGSRFAAWHKASGRLFVLMHAGTHWTHKDAGSEIWVFDIEQKKRIARFPLEGTAGSVIVSQDDQPLLYAVGGGFGPGGKVTVLDPATGEVLRTVPGVSGTMLGVHGY